MRREEKEIPFKTSQLTRDVALEQICHSHNVQLIKEGALTTLRLTETSTDLPGFADEIERYGILDRLDAARRAALLRDLATLECP